MRQVSEALRRRLRFPRRDGVGHANQDISRGAFGEQPFAVAKLDLRAGGVLDLQRAPRRHGSSQPNARAARAERDGQQAHHVAAVRHARHARETRIDGEFV